jgi:hypothetical protein
MPTAGASGEGGRGGTGAGGAGMTGGSGGAGEGGDSGEGGMTGGDGGDSGDSGEGGMSGGDGGKGGDSGEGGMSGDGGGDGGDGGGEPMPAEPGTLYGPCINDAECNDGLFCMHSVRTNGELASSCTSMCGGQGLGQCEDPATGNVDPTCVYSFCLLQACQDRECPLGMSCAETHVALPGGGSRTVAQCVYP